ncbi:hypothetical protein LXL04_034425 [Taraxacum kok-saghyz]
MASEKKESEGIALLSMYGDEDDDMEEDVNSDEGNNNKNDDNAFPTENKEQTEVGANETVNMEEDDSETLNNSNTMGYMYGGTIRSVVKSDSGNDNSTPDSLDNSTQPLRQVQQAISTDPARGREGTLTIVDYGHDEAALSPEAEEGEIVGIGRVMFGAELQTANGTPNRQATPEDVDQSDDNNNVNKGNESDLVAAEEKEGEEALNNTTEEKDYLDKFLPPPPTTKCSDELQEKFVKFLAVKKKTGRSFNSEVRNRKEYRNPDFLTHAVTYQDIDEIGSNFTKHVHDPHGFHPSDFYDEIEADLKREAERKEQEKKKSQKIDFLSGGTQSAPPIPTVPIPAVETATREGRPNKKSKWDKVDGERRHLPVTVTGSGQESVSLVSAANAGSGYTAFAQQRRREAEERRSSDRKLDTSFYFHINTCIQHHVSIH